MATEESFARYALEQIRSSSPARLQKMFGEYALYVGDKVVALLCDNSFFLKPTEAGRALIGKPAMGPPYPGAKPFFVVDEYLDDTDVLTALVEATAAELPAPKPKKPNKAKVKLAKTVVKKSAARKSAAKKTAPKNSVKKPKRVR